MSGYNQRKGIGGNAEIGPTGPTGSQGIQGPTGPTGDIEGFVKDDGSIPFIEPQTGVDPIIDQHLTTKKWVNEQINPPCIETEWEELMIPSLQWRDIDFGGETWIAVADSGSNRIIRSVNNGETWTSPTTPISDINWKAIALDDNIGTCIAVADSGTNRIIRSTDNGLTWTNPITSIPEINWKDISTDGKGTWIAISTTGTGRIFRSVDDGLNWIPNNDHDGIVFSSIETDSYGIWIITSSTGIGTTLRSIDNGLTWESITSGPGAATDISTDRKGVWIACKTAIPGIYRSDDHGLTWNLHSVPGYSFSSINTDRNGLWVAVAAGGTDSIITSKDNGLNWGNPEAIESYWTGIATDRNGFWLAVSYSGTDLAMKSTFICPPEFVKEDGSVPFISPQIGVAGHDPKHLVTNQQLIDSISLSGDVMSDGSVDFTAPQKGVEGTEPNHLTTLGQVEELINPLCILRVDNRNSSETDEIRISIPVSGGNKVWLAEGQAYDSPYSVTMMKSIDNARNWTKIPILDLAVGELYSNGENLWIHRINKNIRLSNDNALTWGPSEIISPEIGSNHPYIEFKKGTSIVLLHDPYYESLLKSNDGGISWNITENIELPPIMGGSKIIYMNNSTWICRSVNKLFVSTDDWLTWTEKSTIESYRMIDASENRIIQLLSNTIKYTDDLGLNWTTVAIPAGSYYEIKTNGNGLWLGFNYDNTTQDRILYSLDDGLTWDLESIDFAEQWDSGVEFNYSTSLDGTVVLYCPHADTPDRDISFAVIEQDCPNRYIKEDGSVPFIAPQIGVPGTGPNHLATNQFVLDNSGGATGTNFSIVEYTGTGNQSTGSGSTWTNSLPEIYLTANGIINYSDWANTKSAVIFINGLLVPKEDWDIIGENSIEINTEFEVLPAYKITIRIEVGTNGGPGSSLSIQPDVAYTSSGIESTGSGTNWEAILDITFITANGQIVYSNWLGTKSAKIYVNGLLVPFWNIDINENEITLLTKYKIELIDDITIQIQNKI